MIFIYNNKEYLGSTAIEIVRAMRLDLTKRSDENESVKRFLAWSLVNMADRIPHRELDISDDLPDEVVAFNYLCVLDRYDGACLIV